MKTIHEKQDFLQDVVAYIIGIEDHIQHYNSNSAANLKQKIYNGIDNIKCVSITCHLHPQSFFQVYNYYIPLLAVKFNLSYSEIVSFQSTFDAMAKTHYYFGAVADFIINAEKNWISLIIDDH